MDQQASNPFGSPSPAAPVEAKRMTAGGAMNRSEAFEAISTRTGRRAGTVAANYYRIARKRGTVAPRAKRGAGRPAASGAAATGDAAAIIDRLETATKDLVALLRSQDAELSRLREQSEQFEKLREWMAKNA